jgi:hypothetical protein
MAPEQLEGTDADARTDIFSLGTVLYEMATGKRAFQGGSMTSLIAAIVSSQPPPIKMMVPVAPAALDHVVRRCLEKDPADRWQSARDVQAELHWIAEAGSQAEVAAPVAMRRKTREMMAWGVAGVLGVAVLGLGLRTACRPPAQVTGDGTRLAFASNMSGRFEIHVRNLGGGEEQWQISTDGGANPKWRADGRELFYEGADGDLMAVPWQAGPGTPAKLFTCSERSEGGFPFFGDTTPDGQRFLLNVPTTSLTSVGFYAITNWPSLPSTAGK